MILTITENRYDALENKKALKNPKPKTTFRPPPPHSASRDSKLKTTFWILPLNGALRFKT